MRHCWVVEQVVRYEFKLVESLLQFSVVVIKCSVTVIDLSLDQSSKGRFDIWLETCVEVQREQGRDLCNDG